MYTTITSHLPSLNALLLALTLAPLLTILILLLCPLKLLYRNGRLQGMKKTAPREEWLKQLGRKEYKILRRRMEREMPGSWRRGW